MPRRAGSRSTPKEKGTQNDDTFPFLLCHFCNSGTADCICISSVLHLLCVVAEQDEEQVESNEAEAELHKVAAK